MIRRLASVERRNAAHRVDHVLVEAWKKPETVLARNPVIKRGDACIDELMAARASAIVDDWHAARLAAGDVAPLEDDHLEATLNQFVRGAHPRHAAAENDDPR